MLLMNNPIYYVLTNNDLLKEITKWYALDHLHSCKFINILCRDENIEKLTWLLNDKHTTINELNKLTARRTGYILPILYAGVPKKELKFYENMDFFDYAYIANSKKIIQYFSHDVENIYTRLDDEIYNILKYMKIFLDNNYKDHHNDDGPLFAVNNLNGNENINLFINFMKFYNNLPQENILTEYVSPKISKNTLEEYILKSINLDSTNGKQKFCGFCRLESTLWCHLNEDVFIKFLLKSEIIELNFFDNILNDIDGNIMRRKYMLYFIYKGYTETISYILHKFPEERIGLNDSPLFKNTKVCEYLIFNNYETMVGLAKNGVNCIDKYLITELLRNYTYVSNSTIKIMQYIETHSIYKKFAEFAKCNKIETLINLFNFAQKHNLLYTDDIITTIISHKDVDFIDNFKLLPNKMKNLCFEFISNNNFSSSISKVIFDNEIEINYMQKIHILTKIKQYNDAVNYICEINTVDQITFKHDDIRIIEIDDFTKTYCQLVKNIVSILNNICPEKIETLCDNIKKINITLDVIELAKINKLNNMIHINQYYYNILLQKNNINVLNSLVICYIPNFEENFDNLSLELKNICVEYLISKNNLELLSKIISRDEIVISNRIKLSIFLKYDMWEKAIAIICDENNNLPLWQINNIHKLIDYIYQDSTNPNNIKCLGIIFKSSRNNQIGDQITIINNLPKSLTNFYELFVMLCDILKTKPYDLDYCDYKRYTLIDFVNEYNLGRHLNEFINNNCDNHIIQNIVTQNMLNLGMCTNHIFFDHTKQIILTTNIYKKNIKNIDHIINHIIIHDNNMLMVLFNYTKTILTHSRVTLTEVQTFLQKIQHEKLCDDMLYEKYFKISDIYMDKNTFNGTKWLFEYLIKHNYEKCLTTYFEGIPQCSYNMEHVKMAKNKAVFNVLTKFKHRYIKTQKKILLKKIKYLNMCPFTNN